MGRRTHAVAVAVPCLLVLLFFAHRLLIVLCAGDFLHPIGFEEWKHTELAWDIGSGRFGTFERGIGYYVSGSANPHHGGYLSASSIYWGLSSLFGHSLLALRLGPLVCTTGSLLIIVLTVHRTVGWGAGSLVALHALLPPTVLMGMQLTCKGSHAEALLPLSIALCLWVLRLERGHASRPLDLLLGAAVAYTAAVSYTLWPMVLLLIGLGIALSDSANLRRSGPALLLGGLLGLWPTILILTTEPGNILASAITEDPSTTVVAVLTGRDLQWDDLAATWSIGLDGYRGSWWQTWESQRGMHGRGELFENRTHALMIFGSLVLLPMAWREKKPAIRGLTLFVALAAPVSFVGMVYASPSRPDLPYRYMFQLLSVGRIWPALAVGLACRAFTDSETDGLQRQAWRLLAPVFLIAGLAAMTVAVPRRVIEHKDAIRPERIANNLEHRHGVYARFSFTCVRSEHVPWANDMIDVRAQDGFPGAADGLGLGLGAGSPWRALALDVWAPPPLRWEALRRRIREDRESKEGPVSDVWSFNLGWTAGIQGAWDPDALATVVADSRSSSGWPAGTNMNEFLRGFGFGAGRAGQASIQSDALLLNAGAEGVEWIEQGRQEGIARGAVPRAQLPAAWEEEG